MTPHAAAAELLRRRRARQSIESFATYTMPDYQVNWHHRRLCELLDRFVRKEITRLMVFMPPRYGKSELVSRRLPAYIFGRNPNASIIATSYSADLASLMNHDVQRIIDSKRYKSLFPGTTLYSPDSRNVAPGTWLRQSDKFEIVGHRGLYRSAGVGGGITGMGFDYGIIDDPIKNEEEAYSPRTRQAILGWYQSTFYTRQAENASILVTLTRWHKEDLAGKLLKLAEDEADADQWTVIKFPAISGEEPTELDPREPGEPLWPAKYSLQALAKTKASVGPVKWAALYQQAPRAEGGSEWPEDFFPPSIWFDEWPTAWRLKVVALDPSKGKDAKFGDFSALVELMIDTDGVLYVDADLDRRNTKLIVEQSLEINRRFRPDGFGVEINQFQELLADQIAEASQARGVMLPIYGIDNRVKKEVRIRRLTPYLGRGLIRFKGGSPGARLLVDQLKDFPNGDHDDGPDALEMAIRLASELLSEAPDDGLGDRLNLGI